MLLKTEIEMELSRLIDVTPPDTSGELTALLVPVQELIFKFNQTDEVGSAHIRAMHDLGSMQFLDWRIMVMIALADTCRCHCTPTVNKRDTRILIEGLQPNVQFLIRMHDFVVAHGRRLAKAEWDHKGKKHFQERQFFTKIYQGYIGTVCSRIMTQSLDIKAKHGY